MYCINLNCEREIISPVKVTWEDDTFYETKVFTCSHEDKSDIYSHVRYMWFEGNYSCDCNRRSFRAGHNLIDNPCGDTIGVKDISFFFDGEWVSLGGDDKNKEK